MLHELRLARESQSDEAVYDPGLYGIALAAGWYLAIGDGSDYIGQLEEELAAALSRGGDALFFYTEDASMTTRLAPYQNGKIAWAITYDGSNGGGEPDIEGNTPRVVADALSQVQSEQEAAGGRDADVAHIFERTAEAGLRGAVSGANICCPGEATRHPASRMLVGFRHDQTLGDGEILPIDILAPSR